MNGFGFVLVVIALLFLWLVLVRPQRRRQRAQVEMWRTLQVGDEVVTAGGLYGEITGFRDDDVLVQIAPELEVRVARRAIGGVITPADEDGDEEDEQDEQAGGTPSDGDESYSG